IESVCDQLTKDGYPRVLALRDLAILDLKSYGLRSVEIASMDRGDFIDSPECIPIRRSKSETGKRQVVLAAMTRQVIGAYLVELDRYRQDRGRPLLGADEPLFVGIREKRISPRWVSSLVSRLLPEGVRPHDLRARIATLMAATGSYVDVAIALGIRPGSEKPYVAASDQITVGERVAQLHARL